MDSSKQSQQQLLPSVASSSTHLHNKVASVTPLLNNKNTYTGLATSERIPTSTWGPFTIVVVVFLVTMTCFILNCNRIRRKVNERRMDRLGLSGTFKQRSFEKRHKELQEADLEWNNNPPMVYEDKLSAPESIHCSKHSSYSSSGWSSHSTLEIAQNHHYNDINFIKNQPPGVQLRLALENSSTSSLEEPILFALTISSKSSKSSRNTNNNSFISQESVPTSLPHRPPPTALVPASSSSKIIAHNNTNNL